MEHATKHATLSSAFFLLAALVGALTGSRAAHAQTSARRPFNPFHVELERQWTVPLSGPVKLIEIGVVTDERKPCLIQMVGSKDHNDYRRKILITHWDGFRFATDSSADFMGTNQDVLLAGRFQVPKPLAASTVTAQAGNTIPLDDIFKKRAKKGSTPPPQQLITTEGFYTWKNKALTRLFPSPPNMKLMLKRSAGADQMVINGGDTATLFEAGESTVQPSAYEFSPDEDDVNHSGYARYGIGLQTVTDAREFLPNVRYVQSYWNGRNRWLIGLLKGKPANLPDLPDVTTGDQLIVYVPKAENRDKSFWELTRPEDWEESWRSEALSGRVLDVRVGDPKNEGKEGIAVLTALIQDRKEQADRQLQFFMVPNGFINR